MINLTDMQKMKEEKEKEYQKLKKKNMDYETFTMKIPSHIRQRLRVKLVAKKMTFKDLIMSAVEKFLEKE